MGAGASTALDQKKREEIKNAKTDEEKLKLFEEFQKRIVEDELKHHHARKIQKVARGRATRTVAKNGDYLMIVFAKFANFGKSKNQRGAGDAIDSTRFRKMIKESKLLHKKKFSNTDCDMTHTKCRSKGEKLLTFTEFLEKALPIIAKLTKWRKPRSLSKFLTVVPRTRERRLITASSTTTRVHGLVLQHVVVPVRMIKFLHFLR